MNEDVLKGSLISCYMRNRIKNYKDLANIFVINNMDKYQLAFYIPLPFMKKITEYYTPLYL